MVTGPKLQVEGCLCACFIPMEIVANVRPSWMTCQPLWRVLDLVRNRRAGVLLEVRSAPHDPPDSLLPAWLLSHGIFTGPLSRRRLPEPGSAGNLHVAARCASCRQPPWQVTGSYSVCKVGRHPLLRGGDAKPCSMFPSIPVQAAP